MQVLFMSRDTDSLDVIERTLRKQGSDVAN